MVTFGQLKNLSPNVLNTGYAAAFWGVFVAPHKPYDYKLDLIRVIFDFETTLVIS